ncbi:hypothetical protein GCM10007157_30400 [Vreelandella hamiltonii]|uniref:Uncharacterized protein n=1 Tax=Vreelandella hamiltonii TaxID=502829 RepID=A0A8H9I5I7_9GAMM|nr:hypothetical protein GCM10007157_30400 [Halomonas hamiltonii]
MRHSSNSSPFGCSLDSEFTASVVVTFACVTQTSYPQVKRLLLMKGTPEWSLKPTRRLLAAGISLVFSSRWRLAVGHEGIGVTEATQGLLQLLGITHGSDRPQLNPKVA